jgi:hypothetical protein
VPELSQQPSMIAAAAPPTSNQKRRFDSATPAR